MHASTKRAFNGAIFSLALCISFVSSCRMRNPSSSECATEMSPQSCRTDQGIRIYEKLVSEKHGVTLRVPCYGEKNTLGDFTNALLSTAKIFERVHPTDLHDEGICAEFVRSALLRSATVHFVQTNLEAHGKALSVIGPFDPFYFPPDVASWHDSVSFLTEKNWCFDFHLSVRSKINPDTEQGEQSGVKTIRTNTAIAFFDEGAYSIQSWSGEVPHGPCERLVNEEFHNMPDGSEDWPNWRRFQHDGLGRIAYSKLVELSGGGFAWRVFVEDPGSAAVEVSFDSDKGRKDLILCGMSEDGMTFVGKNQNRNECWMLWRSDSRKSFCLDPDTVRESDLRFISNDASILAGRTLCTDGMHAPILVTEDMAIVLREIKLSDAIFYTFAVFSMSHDGETISLCGNHSKRGKIIFTVPVSSLANAKALVNWPTEDSAP